MPDAPSLELALRTEGPSARPPERSLGLLSMEELRDRVRALEQELRVEKGNLAVARNKLKQATEHEEIMLSEISKASSSLVE